MIMRSDMICIGINSIKKTALDLCLVTNIYRNRQETEFSVLQLRCL